MSFVLGLTGSIGMGKSTTARMFAEEGCAVWDSDAAVHELYAKGGAAVDPMRALYPEAVLDGVVSRDVLRNLVARDPSALKQIEAVVHPMVRRQQERFIEKARSDIVVLDIPLLFETGRDKDVDAVVVVTVDQDEQERRLASRGTMTAEQLQKIRAQQLPDEEKRLRADYIVTSDTLAHAREQVREIVGEIRRRLADA